MKPSIEIDDNFEMRDDPWATRFHRWAIPITLTAAYWIAVAAGGGLIIFANWLLKTY